MTAIRPVAALPSIMRRDDRAEQPRIDVDPMLGDNVDRAEPLRIVRVQPDAALVAQLMATHLDLPQTRRLRRLDAAEGAAAYRTARADIDRGRRAALPSWTA